MSEQILLVDDEQLIRWSIRERLSKEGYSVLEAQNGREALFAFSREQVNLVLADLKLPDLDGITILRNIQQQNKDCPVIIITAHSTVESAVDAMKLGAYDYISKPFNMDELVLCIKRAIEASNLKMEVSAVRKDQKARYGMENLVGKSERMLEIIELIKRVAKSEATTVLVRGESGTGKDMIARAIHYESNRADKPFMTITCTALQETLLESELFGHERGAFTDAKSQKKGLFELAHGGTIFLDEIGDMSLSLQAKLLRSLEQKTFRRVGGTADITVDARVIAATNKDLDVLIHEGKFREDLYYRLNVIPILVPPLRDRRSDVPLLVEYFIDYFNREFKKNVDGLSDTAMQLLVRYHWPGNIRELKNVLERAVLLGQDEVIGPDDLLFGMTKPTGEGNIFKLPEGGTDIEEVEKSLVLQALQRTNWNQTRAAKLLNITRDQIRYRIEKHSLQNPAQTVQGE